MANVVVVAAILAATIILGNGELVELECPVDCECHYFRINWVTDCSESNLTSIPFAELSENVYILDMNGNDIEDVDPFPSGIKLRRLQMAHNRLTRLDSKTFAGLTYLLDADFSYNAITHIDPEVFSQSPGFITLELQNNPLAEVKENFLNCRTLLYLDLNNCGIRHVNDNFFHNTTNLNTLDLSNNPLERINPGPFDHLVHLRYLKLSGCNLTFVSPKAFEQLENLRELVMSNNKLMTLDWTSVLAPLVRLEILDIGNTGIRNLPGDAFAANNYLRELVLSDNQLNQLGSANRPNNDGPNVLQNSTLTAELTAVLRHLTKLHKLSLSNCSLRRLPNTFDVFEHLRQLDISHNPLSDAFVGLLNPLKSLEYLDMSYCDLGYVGNNTFAQMTALKTLVLSGNKLHTLERGLFRNLTRLESLQLNNCDLKTPVDPRVFGDRVSTNVVELQLGGNPLTSPTEGPLLPPQLSDLEILDLSNCSLSSLNENVFSNSRNLTKLNLSYNKLSGTKDLAFLKKLRKLEHLDLSRNNIRAIESRIFQSNPHILSLNLIGNPFVCNCSIADMWDWAIQEKSDLHVLVGSQPSNFVTGAAKIRKTLSCTYDDETYKILMNRSSSATATATGNTSDRRTFLRKGDLTPIRTWAKYIRDSNCPRRSS